MLTSGDEPLLEGTALSVIFPTRKGPLHAVDGVDIHVSRGETVAVVGESGSGKTTLARTLMGLYRQTSGTVRFHGRPVNELRGRELKQFRARVQMVFQDPYSSLDPRMTVNDTVAEPLRAHNVGSKQTRREHVHRLLESVGIDSNDAARLPAQFSGGQRQRIALARSLALDPEILIADEPVSSLDVSIQAQIVNLLRDIQADRGLSYVLVSHDLGLVSEVADRMVVLYLGSTVEDGPTERVVGSPLHPYTTALIAATPSIEIDQARPDIVLSGEQPSPVNRPKGCSFEPRCPVAKARCRQEKPALTEQPGGRRVACFYPGSLALVGGGD